MWTALSLISLLLVADGLPLAVNTDDVRHVPQGNVLIRSDRPDCPIEFPPLPGRRGEEGACPSNGIGASKGIIWFVHTSEEVGPMGPVSRCSIESAATQNPDRLVVVLSNGWFKDWEDTESAFANVVMLPMDYRKLFSVDPRLAAWYKSKVWDFGYKYHHLGDAVRLALMYGCGGHYMDDDIISVQSFNGIKLQSMLAVEKMPDGKVGLCGASMMFQDPGRVYVRDMIKEFTSTFNAKTYFGWNGPQLLARTWEQRSEQAQQTDTVHVVPSTIFYDIPWFQVGDLFRTDRSVEDIHPDSFGVHLWQSQVRKQLAQIGTDYRQAFIGKLFDKFCPSTFALLPKDNGYHSWNSGATLTITSPKSGQQVYGENYPPIPLVMTINAATQDVANSLDKICISLNDAEPPSCVPVNSPSVNLQNPGPGHHLVTADLLNARGDILSRSLTSFTIDFHTLKFDDQATSK
mmetsp:Transcript_10607/g.17315  ORF Transcript_10607/g.17315 Transcript_10607/m.17315 type:complete len:461 (+) Transcript_10607:2165-3547(+)